MFERLKAALSDTYRLEREVGAGGMATVYVAEDLRHSRLVAIKVLEPQLAEALGAERFLKEIALTARLQHAHILPLFDSGAILAANGTPPHGPLIYYVMPFVEGESLRQRIDRERQLPLDEALDITRQVAGALEYAHGLGVVHRDIKPENILIHHRQALVADFGIALALSEDAATRLTQTGLSIGSPQYMSPEQASGERSIDARTDIYSLGCVLYEMVAGEPPFYGRTAQAIVARKLTGSAPSLRPLRESVSEQLDRVIAQALARTPADRYASMALFADALAKNSGTLGGVTASRRRVLRAAGIALAGLAFVAALTWGVSTGRFASWLTRDPRFQRIAVLPLENSTGDSAQNYVADGLTEALIADLARLERVDVISLASVIGFRMAPKPIDSIARQLGVEAVVVGAMQRRGDSLSVSLQINAPGREAALPDTLTSAADQIAALKHRMVQTLVRRIGGRLAGGGRVANEVSPNADVQHLFLRGRYHLATRKPEGLQNALDYFRQVLAQDPAHAAAYAGLAQYYSLLPFYTNALPGDAFAKAKTAALKAIELNEYLPEAHAALGYVLAYGDWDWIGAERAYRRALALQPSGADWHHALSRLLAARGRIPESIVAAERAHTLDPLSLVAHANIGVIAYFGRDYDEARRRLTATLELDPNFTVAIWGLGLVHEQLQEYRQAVAFFEKVIAIQGRGRNVLSSLGHVLAVSGRKAEAEAILKELVGRGQGGPIQPYMLALVLAGLRRDDEALSMLERSYDDRSALLSYLDRDPRFASLRSHPRFTALLRRMNLTQ